MQLLLKAVVNVSLYDMFTTNQKRMLQKFEACAQAYKN